MSRRRCSSRRALTAATVVAAAAFMVAPSATAAPGLLVGLADTSLTHEPTATAAAAERLGASAFRLTLRWSRGRRELSPLELESLDRAVGAAGARFRLVLSVFGATARDAPQTDGERDDYCAFVRGALARYGAIKDVVIWNEVNKQYFWLPQYGGDDRSLAPAGYVALLARCWDVLHAFRPDVNLITSTSARGNDNPDASSNISHSPGAFVVEMGRAYRASGRARPVFDTVGHHPYGETSRERPWRRHPISGTIGLGDWDKLVQAYHDAFDETAQPNPGRCASGRCTGIWYMEHGFQTTIEPSVAWAYRGAENVSPLVPADGPGDPSGSSPDERSLAPDHATQVTDSVRLAYCQPYVEAYFNFLLADERDLRGWQSGLLWADWSPKPAFHALAAEIAAARRGAVDCSALKGAPSASSGSPGGTAPATLFPPPRRDVQVLRALWPRSRRFNWRNDLWRFRIAAGEHATYRASLVALGHGRRELTSRAGRPRLRSTGSLRRGYLTWVTFGRRRLAPGRWYRMEISLTSAANSRRTVHVAGPAFYVASRAKLPSPR